ncbi:MAG TPA: 50S ribosomal protein L1 [Chloroflexi bacterium]|jgi:large subunit ribosomal protein L1|nr:50S ribosomal protein L1 [Chloroflexota bacterium]
MAKHGKKYAERLAQVDRFRAYTPEEAVDLVKRVASADFNETVDLHLRMNLDPRRADQQIRTVVTLPAGTGKQVRIMVFAEGEAARIAEEAGADYVGTDEYIARIQDGWLEFDVAVAVPQVMSKIGRLGRILGSRGLMPNPRAGTIVQPDEIPTTIQQLRQGRVEFRVDRTGNIHIPIGKVSFTSEQLLANWGAIMEAIIRARPATVRGQYIRRITIAPTMGPGVRVDVGAAQALRG